MKELIVEDFTSEIKAIIEEAEQFRLKPNIVSDMMDHEGNQYVDLVQEGGGVLGIALLGYTYILEKAGIRFLSLAGTSAGAINTLLLAALKEDEKITKSERILEYLVRKDLFEIVDGDDSIKRFIQSYLDGEKITYRFRYLFLLIKAIIILIFRLGINPGKNFENWIADILKQNGINNTDELSNRQKELPGLTLRGAKETGDIRKRVVLVTSDITTQNLVYLPEMAEQYWEDPGKINPARYLRASMSIPLFFRPVKIKPCNPDVKLPGKIRFVDGGLLSNFPISVFHREDRIPRMPTFGVRLCADKKPYNKTNRLSSFLWAMIKTMKQLYDTDFLNKHPDYKYLICHLNTDNKFNWLDFNMKPENKLALFNIGATEAMKFIKGFEWERYKKIRREVYNIKG